MFEDVMKMMQEEEDKKSRAAEVQRIFRETTGMIWDAIPESNRMSSTHEDDVSIADPVADNQFYNSDSASHDNEFFRGNFSSLPDENFKHDQMVEDSRWTANRANKIQSNCVDVMKARAEVECKNGELPNGPVPEGMPVEECMQFWADGVNDETYVNATSKAKTDTIKRTLEGGVEVVIPEVGKAGYKASDETANAATTTASETSTRSVKGSEGYLAQCRKMEADWFSQQTALLPYSD